MIVVADSSPFIVLITIQRIDLLPKLFGQVVIPPQVSAELAQTNRPQPVRAFISSPPPWLLQQAPSKIEPIPMLHAGEAAAISLAVELHADVLLIDEALGRKAATSRRVRVTGTV